MEQTFSKGTKIVFRIGLLLLGAASIVVAWFALQFFLAFFHNTSYIFVGFFLILIALSNALAQLASLYLNV